MGSWPSGGGIVQGLACEMAFASGSVLLKTKLYGAWVEALFGAEELRLCIGFIQGPGPRRGFIVQGLGFVGKRSRVYMQAS